MNISIFHELVSLGLKPFPIKWDAAIKDASSLLIQHGTISEENWNSATIDQWLETIKSANGIALKLFPPFGMIDFDTKNEDEGHVSFNKWFNIIDAECPEVLRKVCIESTRNKGYHVYIKYPKLTHKISLANSESGREIIAVYTGGLVSYCSPTPGYEMFHNSFDDIEELTDDEFELFTSAGILFNKYEDNKNGDFVPIEYPTAYETACLMFDKNIPDEAFEQLLNEMTLYKVNDYRYSKKDKFTAYLRKGSKAKYSAKVYYSTKKLLLFTSSMPQYPSWMTRVSTSDHSWVLTPSRILYYKNNRDWISTIEEIQMIADSLGIEIIHNPVEEYTIPKERTSFPYDIFPESIQQYISAHKIQNEYIAGCMLSALSTAIGNTCYLEALDGYRLKTNLYIAIVAHAGGGKSPAMKIAFNYLQKLDNESYNTYQQKLAAYAEELAAMDKKDKKYPAKPILNQLLINDATIETVINVLQYNTKGCGLVADELAGFMKRMSKYSDGDDTQKWLEMWDSSPVMQQRITAETRRLSDYSIGILGGIQPGVIDILSKNDNQYNGFYHRFLFVYPEADAKPNFESVFCPDQIKGKVIDLFNRIMIFRQNEQKDKYTLSEEALAIYKRWHDNKNLYYNRALDDNSKGIIAKYQAYCLRFALIIQCLDDLDKRTAVIHQSAIERAIRLTEYFLGNMLKSLRLLNPETPIDGLKKPYDTIYNELPPVFTTKLALEIASKYRIQSAALKMWIGREKALFEKKERGTYEKLL
jgi:hypothetical protein